MNSNESISHEGVVTKSAEDGIVEVTITANTACSGCHAKSACGMDDSKEKVITVKTDQKHFAGDIVVVTMEQKQGTIAVLLGYVIPFIVLIVSFVMFIITGAGELTSSLLSFGAVSIYYFVLWLLRDSIEKKFTFKIKS